MNDGAPRIERSVDLRFRGGWGLEHLSRVCGWLMQEFGERAGPHSQGTIEAGRGSKDNLLAVGRGKVDVAMTTPAAFARMAMRGVGPFAGEAHPDLRALGVIPQDDRMVVALDAALGIRTFAELRERRPALRLTTAPNDGINFIGLSAHTLMAEAGISDETLRSWGGSYVEYEVPTPCLKAYEHGDVDGVIQEALTTKFWVDATDRRDTVFLPIEENVLASLSQTYGWPAKPLRAGYLRGLDDELQTLDYSDFLIVVRADMPFDVAELLAWCICETRLNFEQLYHHRDPARSPVTWPLDPVRMRDTPIPLHPGAAAAYDALGYAARD